MCPYTTTDPAILEEGRKQTISGASQRPYHEPPFFPLPFSARAAARQCTTVFHHCSPAAALSVGLMASTVKRPVSPKALCLPHCIRTPGRRIMFVLSHLRTSRKEDRLLGPSHPRPGLAASDCNMHALFSFKKKLNALLPV
jgi:hypothetical protein